MSPLRLLVGLAVLDVAFFGAWIAREELIRRTGFEVKLPVEGYDPRDLLRGHYVQFRLVAEREASGRRVSESGLFCLEEREGRWHVNPHRDPEECRARIRGERVDGRISFGIDRFYVDERLADEVARLPAGADNHLIVHLDPDGGLHPRELVVAGKPISAKE